MTSPRAMKADALQALASVAETSEGERGRWTQTDDGPVWTPADAGTVARLTKHGLAAGRRNDWHLAARCYRQAVLILEERGGVADRHVLQAVRGKAAEAEAMARDTLP